MWRRATPWRSTSPYLVKITRIYQDPRLIERWAAGDEVDRESALRATYSYGRKLIAKGVIVTFFWIAALFVGVGMIAGASVPRLIQYAVLGAIAAPTSLAWPTLAGLGGALGAEILGLDPTFPLKYMIYFLIVVSVGGTSSITGPLAAALLLGVADVAGKYFIPKMGAFTVYLLMILILMWRPQGLFTRKGGR